MTELGRVFGGGDIVRVMATTRPEPPADLDATATEVWENFWSSSVARAVEVAADMPRLVRWIECVDEYDRLARAVRAAPLVKDPNGRPVLNPLAPRLAQLDGQISRAEAEFGMTPMARMRLGIATGQVVRALLHDD